MSRRPSVSFPSGEREEGSGLIWFISLLALLAIFIGTLVAASSEFLVVRQVTDFTEQYALSLKSLLNQSPNSSIDGLNQYLHSKIARNYRFENLQVKSLKLEQGGTVHAVICVSWSSPIVSVVASRQICEEAYAR